MLITEEIVDEFLLIFLDRWAVALRTDHLVLVLI